MLEILLDSQPICLQPFFQQTQTKFKSLRAWKTVQQLAGLKTKINHSQCVTLAVNCLQEVKCLTGKYICLWTHLIHVSRKELKSCPQWSTYFGLRGGYCSLQVVISLHPPPCYPAKAKCHSSEGVLEREYDGVFFPNADRSVLDGRRTILHLL